MKLFILFTFQIHHQLNQILLLIFFSTYFQVRLNTPIQLCKICPFSSKYDRNYNSFSQQNVQNKTEQQKIYKIIKKKNRVSDNIVRMQVKTFLTKLKSLIKKISRSSNTQIQSHTSTCHRLISQLIKDQDILTNMSGNKLRLLAYQSILYLVQVLDYKKDPAKCSESINEKAKISSYLKDINLTLIEVKEMLKKCDREGMGSGRKSYLLSNEAVVSMDKSLGQYAYRLSAIFSQLQKQHLKPPTSTTSITPTMKQPPKQQDYKDCIIQQMQRVVQKKQKHILQLTNQKVRAQNQKLQSQNDYIKYQQLLKEKNDQLERELAELRVRSQELEREVESKRVEKDRLGIQLQVVSVKVEGEKQDNNYNNNNESTISNNKAIIQPQTEQTINSVCQFHHRQSPTPKPSLHRVSSAKSFKRYSTHFEQKQSGFMVQKRLKQTFDKAQDLYMLMLCQASTIEEIL